MVMVFDDSSVDKGADISLFLQHPNEKEFAWVPCSSFVQRVRQGRGRVEVVGEATTLEEHVDGGIL